MRCIRFGLALLGLTAGSGALVAAALLTVQSQSLSKIETPLQVADALDCVMQPRFQKDEIGFGMSRILTINGHDRVASFHPRDEQEKRLMARVNAAGREYTVSFLHCAHIPGKRPGDRGNSVKETTGPRTKRPEIQPFLTHLFSVKPNGTGKVQSIGAESADIPMGRDGFQKLQKVAADAMPRLKQGKDVETECGNWAVVLRPVAATQKSCLNCHTGAKSGDTLGVMVYAVSKTKSGASGA